MTQETKEKLETLKKWLNMDEINKIYGDLLHFYNTHEEVYIGRTSGKSEGSAKEDVDDRLINGHQNSEDKDRKELRIIKPIYSDEDIEMIKTAESFFISYFKEENKPVDNDIESGGGGESKNANCHHIYVAAKRVKTNS